MSARFIDTEIWSEDWFCELGNEYQNFWNYITCNCDNAGIWKPNKIDFEIKSRTKINLVAFLEKVNERGGKERIFITENGRWFITGFIAFQWFNKKESFDLTLSNNLHKHIYDLILKSSIPIKKIRGLREVLETSRVKERVIPIINSLKEEKSENEISENELNQTVEFLGITSGKRFKPDDIKGFWKAFLIYSEKEFYPSRSKKIQHFRNWLKQQKIEVNGKSTETERAKAFERNSKLLGD